MVSVVLEASKSISEATYALIVLIRKAYVNAYEFFEILAYKRKTKVNEKFVKDLAYALRIEYPFESEEYVEHMARAHFKEVYNA